MREVDLDILDLILILLELGVGPLLGVKVGEDLIVDPQLETLTLLDYIHCKSIQFEGVLEGDASRQFAVQKNFAIHGDLDLAGNEGEVEDERVCPSVEGKIPTIPLLAALDMFADILHVEPQSLNCLHLNYSIQLISPPPIMHPTNTILLLLALTLAAHALPDPIYTIHYVKSYRRDLIENNFGCGKSIVYGTYLHNLGAVDALYALTNSNIYGFNANCQRKDTYMKIFGQAQDFQKLTINTQQIIDQIAQALSRAPTKNLIIDWKYLPEESKRQAARNTLEQLVVGLQKKAFTVFVKAPASYFCLIVAGKKYILDLPIQNLIAELYGEEPGKYVTYDSVFGSQQQNAQNGYTGECPKYPSQGQLQSGGKDKKIYFQKTLDSSKSGFVKRSTWQQFLSKAGEQKYNSIYFYDGFPLQTVDL